MWSLSLLRSWKHLRQLPADAEILKHDDTLAILSPGSKSCWHTRPKGGVHYCFGVVHQEVELLDRWRAAFLISLAVVFWARANLMMHWMCAHQCSLWAQTWKSVQTDLKLFGWRNEVRSHSCPAGDFFMEIDPTTHYHQNFCWRTVQHTDGEWFLL